MVKALDAGQQREFCDQVVLLAAQGLKDFQQDCSNIGVLSAENLQEFLEKLKKVFFPTWGLACLVVNEGFINSYNETVLKEGGLKAGVRAKAVEMEEAFKKYLSESPEVYGKFMIKHWTKSVESMLAEFFEVQPLFDLWKSSQFKIEDFQHMAVSIKLNTKMKEKFTCFLADNTDLSSDFTQSTVDENKTGTGSVDVSLQDMLAEDSKKTGNEKLTTEDYLKYNLASQQKFQLLLSKNIGTMAESISSLAKNQNNLQTQLIDLAKLSADPQDSGVSSTLYNDFTITQQLHHFFLPENDLFSGTPRSAVTFTKHLVESVFPNVKNTLNRITIIKRCMSPELVPLFESEIKKYGYEAACHKFIVTVLGRYSDRLGAANDILEEFFKSNFPFRQNEEYNPIFCTNFMTKLEALITELRFFGMSNLINNFHFYNKFISCLPFKMYESWNVRVQEKDLFLKEVFGYDEKNNSIHYWVRKTTKLSNGSSKVNVEKHKYPAEADKNDHEVSFKLQDFIDFLKDFWLKRKANSFYNSRGGSSGNSDFQGTSNLGFGNSDNGQNHQSSLFALNSGTGQQRNNGKQCNSSQIRKKL